jgi:catechol 2,3-dioxygenase-like lactoylglutathione lyase family enzyme
MKARSMSHTAITVRDFDEFVQFYAKHFGCRLVGVSDSDAARVRTFFGVDAPQNEEPKCKIGWLRIPGGGMLEIFHFTPQQPRQEVVWSRVGMTHFSLDVKDCYKWHDYLAKQGVTIVSEVERSKHGHTFFFIKDCDGNLIELIDLKIRYPALKYLGWLGGWLFRRGMYKEHYG